MKALILNSGLGTRMGDITKTHPKCMTELINNQTIIERQLDLLNKCNIKDVVITTGPFEDILINYCDELFNDMNIKYVNNPFYKDTNYIYSIYCAKELLNDDIVLLHGDLVFSLDVLRDLLNKKESSVVVSSTLPLPEKDFKALIKDDKVLRIGIDIFDNTIACQPLYKLNKDDWSKWLDNIINYCENDNRKCYAENALNEVLNDCDIHPFDVRERLCFEVDNQEDLKKVQKKLEEVKVYVKR